MEKRDGKGAVSTFCVIQCVYACKESIVVDDDEERLARSVPIRVLMSDDACIQFANINTLLYASFLGGG